MNQGKTSVVLTIDDDQAVRESLANFLEDFGYEVLQAGDGQQGLEVFAANRPDLILVDLRMPRMDGLQVLARVQELSPQTPIMVISGAGDIRDVVEALRRGAWDYLVKPIQDMNILLHSVETCLERARLQRQNLEYQQSLEESLEKLHRTQKEMIQSAKMAALGDLVAGVAHEVNTPIGVSVTAASFLAERTRQLRELYGKGEMKRSDLEKYLALAEESSGSVLSNLERAAELVQSFKKVAADQSSEEKRVFEMKNYLEQILLSLRPQFKRTPHQVRMDCPDDLSLDSYPGAIMQIITNLIMNSLIHGFADGRPGEISIKVEQAGENVVLTYRDTGIGMDREQKERIYDPFYTTTRGSGGTGLGMNIVYNLVTQTLKGSIMLETSPGQGAVFYLTLPRDPDRVVDVSGNPS
ncbi:response regulator [Desulfomicrobium baculatum]|uniref:histidine kinase n=1 Tax=Desulfomicrobium baculatum (strain DSM 4028 / VKM B-1378 / X) TaxID=525897 RepID=C7LUI8_DESBD|nr:response regulator [Desulfomicrobium baculatum]ACU90903.1 response regulator receiver sensor signal transduction histidine kinase [Desulfomicrobium baculatum DSM 4028]